MKLPVDQKLKIIMGVVMITPGLLTIIIFLFSIIIPIINLSVDLPIATLFGLSLIAGAITLKTK